ncbi:FUSC family protein, partial [Frankia sp. CN6]
VAAAAARGVSWSRSGRPGSAAPAAATAAAARGAGPAPRSVPAGVMARTVAERADVAQARGGVARAWIVAWHRLAVAVDELAAPSAGSPPPLIPPTRDILLEGLRPDSPAWPWAARCAVATFGAALLAIAAGIERPYWAPVAAAAVLEVRTARVAGQRTVQRAVGTGVGALAAIALLAVPLPVWALIAVATVLQGGVQLLNVANHALGSVLLTPLTLLLVEFARPGIPVEPLIRPRVLDTLLGVMVGLIAAWSLWPRAAARRLPHALAESIDATGALLALELAEAPARDGNAPGSADWEPIPGEPAPGEPAPAEPARRDPVSGRPVSGAPAPGEPAGPGLTCQVQLSRLADQHDDQYRRLAARHHVEASLAWLSELQVDAENEPGETARAAWPAVVAARRLGYLVLVEPKELNKALRATRASPEAIRALFDRLARGVMGDSAPPPREPPQLPPFPPLQHEFAALVDAAPDTARG